MDGWDPDAYEEDEEMSKRNNSDSTINRFGKDLLNFCKEAGFRIINGESTVMLQVYLLS